MKTSAYPRDYKHEKDGKVCKGRFREFRKPTVPIYGSSNGEMEEKLLVELDLVETGETVTYWLPEGKLLSLFRQELKRRLQLGKENLEPGELLTITQSDEQRPSKTTGNMMWDYGLECEFGAPPPTAAELVLGQSSTDVRQVEIPTAAEGDEDDVPF
jgi:hypothetical protein